MNRAHLLTLNIFLSSMLALAGCAPAPDSKGDAQAVEAVRAVMLAQQAAWNRGDVEAFMDGYERAGTTTFVSGEELTRGWQTVLDRYRQRYASREQMGSLDFSELDIRPLTSSYVLADGRWRLTRANDSPQGRFTLLFRKTGDAWRIVHDTTTSATP
jgi:ketosteroid isomerase-like protein